MRLGNDVDHLDRLQVLLDRGASSLVAARSELLWETAATTWFGPGRLRVVEDLQRAMSMADNLADRLRDLGGDARTHADSQRRISGDRRPGLGDAPVTLLSLDGRGDGRAVVAIGDIATATHLVVLVPGMGSDLGNFDELTATARRLQHHAALQLGGSGSVAVIAWLGYDAPAGLDEPTGLGQVLDRTRADAGATALRSFLDQLSRRNDALLTVIGHSYGSLVVAGAARANDGIDRVVVLGSPGLGVDDVDGLGLAPGTAFYAAAFDADPVPGTEWFGTDPSSFAFGGIPVTTEPWPLAHSPGPLHAHSAYFDECSQSLDNLARLVTGGQPRGAIM